MSESTLEKKDRLFQTEFYYPSNFAKSNYLINARYNSGLLENQLLALALQRVEQCDNAYISKMTAAQIKKILGKSYHDFYTQLKRASMKLLDLKFMIEIPEIETFRASNLITDCISKDGEFTVVFNPELKKLIFNLSTNFTTLSIEQLVKLESVASFRIYETLKSKCYYLKNVPESRRTGKYQIQYSLAEFKVMLNAIDINHPKIAEMINNHENPNYEKILEVARKLAEDDIKKNKPVKDSFKPPKWERWERLKSQVLDPAVEEISEKTDIEIKYEPEKASGKVVGITFFVTDKDYDKKKKKTQQVELMQEELDNLIDEVRDFIDEKIKTQEIRSLLAASDNDIEKIKKAYNIAKAQGTDNLVGFLISAIKNDYQEPIKVKKRAKGSSEFSNQRDYDYDELEKRLLKK